MAARAYHPLFLLIVLALLPPLLFAENAAPKSPIPTPAVLKDAAKLLNDTFKDDLAGAKTADQKAAVAAKLLNAARDEKNPANRFALLTKARDLACDARDFAVAQTAIDAIDKDFAIDALKMKLNAAVSCAKADRTERTLDKFVVEACIDGDSELHITPAGIYWVEKGAAKPGMHDGKNEPTYIDGEPWAPKWGDPTQSRGNDKSELRPLPIGKADFTFAVIAIAPQRGEKGSADRGAPVTIQKARDEWVVTIPDPAPGAIWYTLKLSKTADAAIDAQITFAQQLTATIDQALAADRFDIALSLAEIALAAAHSTDVADLIQQTTTHMQQVHEAQSAYGDAKKSLAILFDKPDDPDANLKFGKYRCYIKSDWKNGLPMLAHGSDPALKSLAAEDIAGPNIAGDPSKCADAWWDIADKLTGLAKQSVRNHAADLYQQALPLAKGLIKTKIELRLKSLTASDWVILLRSADPSLWNTAATREKDAYAIPLHNAPRGIQYLRIALPNGDCVIIPMSNARLATTESLDVDRYLWNGNCQYTYNAYHLGILSPKLPYPDGCVDIEPGHGAGWGFGNHLRLNDKQGFGWAGKEIGSTIFEISVKTAPLTDAEKQFLHE